MTAYIFPIAARRDEFLTIDELKEAAKFGLRYRMQAWLNVRARKNWVPWSGVPWPGMLCLLLALSQAACLPGTQWPFLSPFKDTVADEWCAGLTRGQAVYGSIVGELDARATGAPWGLSYGLAKGVLDVLGPRLITKCERLRAGESLPKESIAFETAQGAAALRELVNIHEAVMQPAPTPGEPLSFLSASVRERTGLPHAELRKELLSIEAQATAVLADME